MTGMADKLSAYLDGELPPGESAEVAAALDADPALRATWASLVAANDAAARDFAEMLAAPVPLSLARAIGAAPAADGPAANSPFAPVSRRFVWGSLAAALACLAVGAGGGWLAGQRAGADRDWVADVGDYHAVYAGQTKHLVEVTADNPDQIVSWLSKSVGQPVRIPDLSAQGFAFQGARLLVAAGKPVGQLMYRDGGGQIVAICMIASAKPPTAAATSRDLGEYTALTWGDPGLRWLLIGPTGDARLPDLTAAARAA
jgi:anti-sigma factor RsiW